MTRSRMQRTGWNKRLLASTRGRILALLRSENHTVNELATALDLTDNAVRAHLLSLERDGLVQKRGTRPGRRKPHAAYWLSTEAEHVFPKAYGPLLAHFMTVLSNRFTASVLRVQADLPIADDWLQPCAVLTSLSPRLRVQSDVSAYNFSFIFTIAASGRRRRENTIILFATPGTTIRSPAMTPSYPALATSCGAIKF